MKEFCYALNYFSDQEMLRGRSQPFNRTLHCEEARPIDVDRVNFLDFDKCNTPGRSFFFDFLREFVTRT